MSNAGPLKGIVATRRRTHSPEKNKVNRNSIAIFVCLEKSLSVPGKSIFCTSYLSEDVVQVGGGRALLA
jgi:hypothetical protein